MCEHVHVLLVSVQKKTNGLVWLNHLAVSMYVTLYHPFKDIHIELLVRRINFFDGNRCTRAFFRVIFGLHLRKKFVLACQVYYIILTGLSNAVVHGIKSDTIAKHNDGLFHANAIASASSQCSVTFVPNAEHILQILDTFPVIHVLNAAKLMTTFRFKTNVNEACTMFERIVG